MSFKGIPLSFSQWVSPLAGEQFRFDWFVLFLELVVLILLTISVATRLLEETRAAMIGFLSGGCLNPFSAGNDLDGWS